MGWLTSRPDKLSFFIVPPQGGGMDVENTGDSVESSGHFSCFVIPPQRGGMEVYSFAFCSQS
ncbi:MAG: hypothetical protein D3910_02950 [Candidatus Electrothrix sp. ATG2]|nr:hypothetical protein [Candidatus Electrothrix sp. ATG2]